MSEKMYKTSLEVREKAKANYKLNRIKKLEYARQYSKDNVDKIKAYNKVKYDKIKDRLSEYNKKRYKEKREEILAKVQAYRDNHKEKIKQRDRDYAKRNPHVGRAIKANYKKSKKKATPAWLTKEHYDQIREFHKLAIEMQKETGIEHHVDHIVPLQGLTVSGLHVPWNLRVISHSENRSKSNKLLQELL